MSAKPLRIDDGDSDGVWPSDDYTGEWAVHWPNGQLKYLAHYVNGQTEGEVTCYWENGHIAQRGTSAHGKCHGIWTDYHQDGTRSKETDYEAEGDFTVRWFDSGGVEFRNEIWKGGVLIQKLSTGEDIFAELDEIYDQFEEDDD